MSNPNKGKWYRFNDTVVEEFEMTEESLENECFGGKYKAKFSDTCKFHFDSFAKSHHKYLYLNIVYNSHVDV